MSRTRVQFFLASLLSIPPQAFAQSDAKNLQKLAAIQQAEIQALRMELAKLRTETDQRFRKLKISISDTRTYYKTEPNSGYTPRAEYLWQDDPSSAGLFTGFNCPSDTVNSGADYWKTAANFHRVYCRELSVKDPGW